MHRLEFRVPRFSLQLREVKPMPTDPLPVVARFNEACQRHDAAAGLALLAADVVFEATEPAPDGTRFSGREAITDVLGSLIGDPSISFDIEETLVAGDRVIQRTVYRWNSGHVRGVDLYRVRDGQITELLSYVKG